jgi:hypothetical protein
MQTDGPTIHSPSWQPDSNRLSGRNRTMNTSQLRQGCDRGRQLIQIGRQPDPIEDDRIAAICTHRNRGTVSGCSAPAIEPGRVKSQTNCP